MACDYIHARLGDGALTPRAISLHLGISTRTLYRLFEPMGGVAAFIQNKRLERAHDAIVRRGRGVSLAEIGYAHGFSSASHFSRAFRAHFGFPPGEACDVEKPAHRSSSMSTFSSTIVDWCKD
jgi:AraC-like DNA-binding protein